MSDIVLPAVDKEFPNISLKDLHDRCGVEYHCDINCPYNLERSRLCVFTVYRPCCWPFGGDSNENW